MKKRIKRWLTFSLAFMLILGSMNYSPLTANATAVRQPEITDSVSGNDNDVISITGDVSDDTETVSGNLVLVSKAQMLSMGKVMVGATTTNLLDGDTIGGNRDEDIYLYASADNFASIRDRWNGTFNTYTENTNKTISIETSGQGTELLFTLQEPIDATQVEAITFAMSAYDGAWAYKIYDENLTQLYVNYDVNTAYYTDKNIVTIDVDKTEGKIGAISVMCNTADSATCTFDGVMIDMVSQTSGNLLDGEEIGGNRDEDKYLYANSDSFSSIKDRWSGSTDSYERDDANKTITINSTGAYQELWFTLAEPVEAAKVKSITFAMSEYTGKWHYKVYIDGAEAGTYTKAFEGEGNNIYTIAISETEGSITAISVMSDAANSTCTFDGVMIDLKSTSEEEPTETYTVTVYPSAFACYYKNATTAELTEDKRFNVVFNDTQYSEARLELPIDINLADCESITFNVKDQVGPVNFNVWYDETKVGNYYDHTGKTAYVLTSSDMYESPAYAGNIDAVGVQRGGSDADAGIVLESVVFTMKSTEAKEDQVYGEAPITEEVDPTENLTPATTSEYDKRFTYTDGGLTVQSCSNEQMAYTAQDVEKVAVTFNKEWDEIKFALPEEIDLARCTSVTFATSDQTVPLAYKLYDTDGNEITDITQYTKTGTTCAIAISGRTEKVGAVAIMLHSNDVAAVNTCVFDGVLFKMTEAAVETHTVTYTADQLELSDSNAASCTLVNGNYVMTFSKLLEEVTLKLPDIINMANCVNIQVTVSGQTGPVNYYLQLDGTQKDVKYYNTADANGDAVHTITSQLTSGGMNEIRIQCGGEEYTENSAVTIEKVTFTMQGSEGTNDFLTDEDEEPDELVPGTANITPAGDGVDDISLQAGTLKVAGATTATYAKTDTNQFQVNFAKQYDELKLNLETSVNLLQCTSVTFAVSEQSSPLAFKLYTKDGTVVPKYDNADQPLYTFDLSRTGEIVAIGVMMNESGLTDQTCVFDGVMFDVDPGATTQTYTITYPASELILDSSEAESCELVNGNYMIRFSNMDQNVNFKLPASVNLEKCVNIIFTVATQNGPVNFNVSLDKTKLKDYWYNTGETVYTLEPGIASKINEIGIQCGRENDAFVPGSFVELVSVSFLMKGTEPKDTPTDGNYTMDFFDINDQSEGVSLTVDENGTATITFPKTGDSITYEIPDSVDVNHMTSMEFLKSLQGVQVNLLDAKGRVLFSGTESIFMTNCNPEVKYIQLVSLADHTVLTLDSIMFHVDPNAFEAIVLNGNFAREDVSMWGAALWGSVDGVSTEITVKTSDTPIWEDIYTYGEINRRSSPYVCFAQNVIDRTTPATGYIFSFWAKLSDDYVGAPAELRTVEFSPYYIDANGKENYSMTRTGAYKQVLEPGVWTHFYGVVGLPDGAQGFIIRIVEQGTNYGQGECLLGSYAVTGVSLTPTDYPPEPSWGRSSGGSGSQSNTVTKEATCEVTYAIKNLAIDWASAVAKTESDKLRVSFTNNYDEVRLKLPRTLDMSTCAWIKVSIPEQNVPVAIKLYYKGQQVDVAYYNDISASYLMVPVYEGKIDGIGIMSLATPNPEGAYALADCITFGLTQELAPEEVSDTIVINGDFADEDMSDWSEALWGNGVTITQKTSSTPIYGDTYTYATYSRRSSPYQCFAQDITGRVEQNETYTFSFWAKLSDDYAGAPDTQRVVQFAPYTVDNAGNADYNPRLDGTYAQVMEPGVWYYFEGTYKVTNDNPISKVVIRILEQGTNYGQGDCVMGSYSVAGVHMERYIPEPPSIDEDVPNLKDAMAETFGNDFITGTAITVSELDDLGVEMLINKHFNAVTIGNELKADALFNYSNDQHTPLQTITFNGQSLEVPTLYFSRAEEILDKLLEWNENNPENPIKVRGHVLVWHSQTPEWFFREGYTVGQNADGSENYVTPEVMNLRLEWFIKTVLEHFTGEDSPYKDMFYGWDVVNEAVSNAGNGYRTDKVSAVEPLSQSTHSSNSSWWAVYQSNEYILNAFRYANQYAPADVELYYNDYNECDYKKMLSIVRLLTDVKEAEGTRIDGMGMQGHYNMFNPSVADIERAVRAYAEVVGMVQYTELDMKVSGDISTDDAQAKEYLAQAERYHDIYMVLKKLDAEEGIEVSGLTIWGTVDKYSWLQSSSDVGGGADGTLTQCPLLFDSNYKVKPSYWAFVDYTMVDPDWTEESEEETVQEPEEAVEETEESVSEPEAEPEAEPAAESDPVVTEEKKSSPAVPIAIAAGAVVVGAGAGAAVYFGRKKTGAGKKKS